MSFFGLTGVDHPYCPICDTAVHLDYVFNELRLGNESMHYKCTKCGTEMIIESWGDSFYDVYPDEETFPEGDVFDNIVSDFYKNLQEKD